MVGGRRGVFGLGFEIGGGAAVNTYPMAAYIAMGVGVLILAWGGVDWIKSYPDEPHHWLVEKLIVGTRRRLVPLMLGVMALAGILLIAASAIGYLAYSQPTEKHSANPAPSTIPAQPETHKSNYFPEEKQQLNAAFARIHSIIEGGMIPAIRTFEDDLGIMDSTSGPGFLSKNEAKLDKDWQAVTLKQQDIDKIINDPNLGTLKQDILTVVKPSGLFQPGQRDLNYDMGSYVTGLKLLIKKVPSLDAELIQVSRPTNLRLQDLMVRLRGWCSDTREAIEAAQRELRK